jgi:hypothetical protein
MSKSRLAWARAVAQTARRSRRSSCVQPLSLDRARVARISRRRRRPGDSFQQPRTRHSRKVSASVRARRLVSTPRGRGGRHEESTDSVWNRCGRAGGLHRRRRTRRGRRSKRKRPRHRRPERARRQEPHRHHRVRLVDAARRRRERPHERGRAGGHAATVGLGSTWLPCTPPTPYFSPIMATRASWRSPQPLEPPPRAPASGPRHGKFAVLFPVRFPHPRER